MIEPSHFTNPLTTFLAETFGVSDSPDAYMLESGRSGLLGTINAISADTASAALTPQEPTIAAHCGHILFLLSFFGAIEQGQTPVPDWEGGWSRRVVDEAAWAALREELQTTYAGGGRADARQPLARAARRRCDAAAGPLRLSRRTGAAVADDRVDMTAVR